MRDRIRRLFLLILIAAAVCWSGVVVADDFAIQLLDAAVAGDDDEPNGEQLQPVQGEFSEENFEQWIFGGRNASTGRQKLETQLKLQMDAVDRECQLNDSQKNKLLLAGRGDIKRFWEHYEVTRQKFLIVRKDQQKMNEIWQEIQPLQMTLNAGLFNDQSFLLKTIRNTLDAVQTANYDTAVADRRLARYHAKLELMVAMLEAQMPLRHEQREKVLKLLREETKPPHRSAGQYEYYVVMLQASKIPEDKLKPLFDAAQWKIVKANLAQGRGMEEFLKQNGLMPDGAE